MQLRQCFAYDRCRLQFGRHIYVGIIRGLWRLMALEKKQRYIVDSTSCMLREKFLFLLFLMI